MSFKVLQVRVHCNHQLIKNFFFRLTYFILPTYFISKRFFKTLLFFLSNLLILCFDGRDINGYSNIFYICVIFSFVNNVDQTCFRYIFMSTLDERHSTAITQTLSQGVPGSAPTFFSYFMTQWMEPHTRLSKKNCLHGFF